MCIYKDTLRDYGVPPTMAGVRLLESQVNRDSKIKSPGHYLHVCRMLANSGRVQMTPEELDEIDNRLVVQGWNRVSPRDWLSGEIQLWLGYWDEFANRPDVVGSLYNGSVDWAFLFHRVGLSAALAKRLPFSAQRRVVNRHGAHNERASEWFGVGIEIRGRISKREKLRLVRIARAVERHSIKKDQQSLWWCLTTKALEALGRLTPELQAAALDGVSVPPGKHRLRIRDLNWERAAQVQQLIRTQPEVAVAWANGKRQMQLLGELRPWLVTSSEEPMREWLADLFPQWKQANTTVLLRRLRGESLSQLGGGILDVDEVVEWLECGAQVTPEEFLRAKLQPGSPKLETLAAVRWLVNAQKERRNTWTTTRN